MLLGVVRREVVAPKAGPLLVLLRLTVRALDEVVGAGGAAIVGSRGGPNFFFVLSTSAAPPTFRIFFNGSLNKSLASFSSTVRPGPSKRRRNEVDEEGAFCQADF